MAQDIDSKRPSGVKSRAANLLVGQPRGDMARIGQERRAARFERARAELPEKTFKLIQGGSRPPSGIA